MKGRSAPVPERGPGGRSALVPGRGPGGRSALVPGRGPGDRPALVLAAAALLAVSPGAVRAQEGAPPGIPRPGSGVATALLPLQTAEPLPDGGWPGAADGRRDLLGRFNAELDFALEEAGAAWTSPGELQRLARRNPILEVDPHRVTYRVLPAAGEDLPAPLHGQLRNLAALAGTRYVVLPVRLRYAPAGQGAPACFPEERVAEGRGPAAGETSTRGRAVLCLALVDARLARVVWRGSLRSGPVEAGAPGLLAELAQGVVRTFVE